MTRTWAKARFAAVVSVVVSGVLSGAVALASVKASAKAAGALTPKVLHSVKSGRSAALRDIHAPSRPPSAQTHAMPDRQRTQLSAPRSHDGVVQRKSGLSQPSPQLDFSGSSAADDSVADLGAVSPASSVMDVGAGHVVQTVNSVLQVWDTSGNQQLAPIATTSIFAGLGGQCGGGGFNAVDTVIRFDELAGRWVLAFVPYDFSFVAPFDVCVAVSTSSDPTGTWSTYAYQFDNLVTNPRLGVWPDGYYLAFDQLDSGFNFAGIVSVAFDRAAMIGGAESATAIQFSSASFLSMVPADLDGSVPPAEGAPNPQASPGEANWDGSPNPVIHMFQFHADFATPENSTLDGPFDVSVPDFNPALCAANGGFNCIPALNGADLNSNAGFLMNGMQYRNLGDHESLVVSQTVNVSEGGDQAGVRWYEVRPTAAAQGGAPPFSLFQSGTYAPTDTNRWMSSIAMDVSGDIAMGYSVSDATIHPEIGLTGRLAGDPLGEMGSELIMTAGNGSQQSQYWGNYTSMVVDPTDGCTFWYTNEYYDTDSDFNWLTRIGSFRYPSCTSGATGAIHGTVTDGANPIAGAKVTAGLASTTTSASGAYSFTLPVGTYDMTALKYGYLPGSANGIVVADGSDVVQDFVLSAAPSVTVNGVVKDGSGGGWPLYAKVVITASGAPTFSMYTDPVTGYYSQTLVSGIPYTFQVTAVSSGYLPGGGTLPLFAAGLAPTAVVANWNLNADLVSCNAAGYAYPAGTLFEGFSTGALPAGWTNTNPNGGGTWRFPTGSDQCGRTNNTGGTGGFAIADSDCDGFVQDDMYLNTPSLDFSGVPNPILSFNSEYIDLSSFADVDVSTDGGSNWTNVWERAGADDPGPSSQLVDLSAIAGGQADARARFHFYGFWAWWWEVDNVLLGDPSGSCSPLPGGLVVGNVFNANTGGGLNGAAIDNLTSGGSVKTFATPDDPAQPDGLYILFSESGSNDLKASLALYGSDQHTVTVIPNGTIRRDFTLQSGNVSASPSALNARVNPFNTTNQTLTLKNTGGAAAGFELVEINAPALASVTHGFASDALRRQALARLSKDSSGRPDLARSARGLAPLPGQRLAGSPMAAGDVVASYPTGITFGWGVATSGANFWLSNLGVAGGDDKDYQYDASTGAQTGSVMDDSGIGQWAADGAFNSSTGMVWRVAVGGDNCLHELNPATLSQTGNTVCGSPWTNTSQRGMAYDAINNAYFVGGWNEGIVYHVDGDGNVIDSASVGLPISGMAYDASNGHLLVMSNTDGTDITVLDALNNYAVIGSYNVMDGGSRAFGAFEQAGIEFDCLGNLWAVNQITQVVYNVATGEAAGCAVDIPWLSENPTEGSVSAGGGTTPVTVSFDSLTYLPGLKQAQLQVKTDTPSTVPAIPVTLTVRFLDVPDDNQFQAFIYGIAGAGVMFGGTPVCSDMLHFCPNGVVTRADMAGYLFRALHGATTPPPVYQNTFLDVSFNDYNAFYIQGIWDDGITAGCSANPPLYCPNVPVTRAQMSVFVWKDQHGSEPPPACTGVFNDVPCPDGFAVDYIEGLYNEGVTAGCGGGNFCPNGPITNGQMSVFIVKAFNIPYLP